MPRTVIITPNVRQRLRRYIYNITINPSVEPKYKVDTLRQAIDKANIILNDLYYTLSNEFVLYKPTQFNVLGKSYGYRQYQYKDKSSKTVWLFGCDTTPLFNFVMIMQNSKLCLSHVEHQGNIIIENKQYNTMKNTRNRVRLTESQLHEVIKESVHKVINEIGNYGQNYIKGEHCFNVDPRDHEEYTDCDRGVNDSEISLWDKRDYFNESSRFANKKQSNMLNKRNKRVDVFYDKDGSVVHKKDYLKDGDGIPKSKKISESQLHNIIKEAINSTLNEAYNTVQYANLAGQANGALNTFGGKIKGLFNPKWKARKQRQEKLFGRGGNSSYNRIGSSAMADNTNNSSYQHDYFSNKYNNDRRGENPYEIERSQYNMPNAFDIQHGNQDGQTISRQDFRNKYGQNGQNIEGYDDVAYENSKLNNAYQQGRNAAMGKYKDGAKTYGGVRLNGTGTKNGAFQHYGEDR